MSASTIVKNFTDGQLTATDDAAHSATLLYSQGNYGLSGLRADGREVTAYESRGSITSVRRTTRAKPTISVSGQLTEAYSATSFRELCLGMAAGFVSTLASKGDAKSVDLAFTFNYGAETHTLTCEDCVVAVDRTEGDPSEDSFSFDVFGRVLEDGVPVISTP